MDVVVRCSTSSLECMRTMNRYVYIIDGGHGIAVEHQTSNPKTLVRYPLAGPGEGQYLCPSRVNILVRQT